MDKDLLELKRIIEGYLEEINERLLQFSVEDDDAEFLEMIAKAIYYREQVKKIDNILKNI
jgi:Ni,Fe-hydrogenase III large subunit